MAAVTGDLGGVGGIFAVLAAIFLTLRGEALACGMTAFVGFFRHEKLKSNFTATGLRLPCQTTWAAAR